MIEGDFNNDNIPDIASCQLNGDSIAVLLGLGNSTFATPVLSACGSGPLCIASGHVNNDGNLDLVVVLSGNDSVAVLFGTGNGGFAQPVTAVTLPPNPNALVLADLNGDGHLDIAVTDGDLDVVSVYLGNGTGQFSASAAPFGTGGGPISVVAGDLDGDGKKDLVTANIGASAISVLLNTGGGNFAAAVNYSARSGTRSVYIADFNADQRPDVAAANEHSGDVSVFLGTGDGSLQLGVPFGTGTNPQSVVAADFNNDGMHDIATANLVNGTVSILLGLGNGDFLPKIDYAAGTGPRALTARDFNGDGFVDIVAANASSNSVAYLQNADAESLRVAYVRATAQGAGNGQGWNNAFTSLQAALSYAAATPCVEEIWVAKGTYTPAPPNGPRTASFSLRNNLGIYGGFAGNETSLSQRNITQNPTVLSGDLNNDDSQNPFPLGRGDNSIHVLVGNGTDASAVLNGFTVKGGFADGTPFNDSGKGGGLFLEDDAPASPRVRNCRFEGNVAATGGGTYAGSGSSPLFTDCEFVANIAWHPLDFGIEIRHGGAVVCAGPIGDLLAQRCLFEGNTALDQGGAVYVTQGSTGAAECRFLNNHTSTTGRGGAVCASGNGAFTSVRCRFEGNTASSGFALAALFGGSVHLDNCAVVGNQSSSPTGFGAIATENNPGFVTSSQISLTNCTVAYNTSNTVGAGVVRANQGDLSLTNSIIWGNTVAGVPSEAAQVSLLDSTRTFRADWCSIQAWSGTGTTSSINSNGLDPLFTQAADPIDGVWGNGNDNFGNLRLCQGSPSLDTASNSAVLSDVFDFDDDGNTTEPLPYDLDGSPRIQNSIVDRGCYEGFRCAQCPDDRQWFSPQSGVWSDDFRWSFSGPTFCHYAVFDLPGSYAVAFGTGDRARGIDQTRADLTLIGATPTSALSLAPAAVGQSCSGLIPEPQRPSLRVSGSLIDSPSLSIVQGRVEPKSGAAIGDLPNERGSVAINGVEARLSVNFGAGHLDIGNAGTGSLDIINGGTCLVGTAVVGETDRDTSTPPDGIADNTGFLTVDGPGSSFRPRFQLQLNHGVVTVSNGGLIDGGASGRILLLNGSVLTGDGEVRAEILNLGDVAPGEFRAGATGAFAPTNLTLSRPAAPGGAVYNQLGTDLKTGNTESGSLRLRVSGTGGAIQSDSLIVSGSATLAGSLVVKAVGTFDPGTDAPAAALLSATTVTGRFDLAVFPGLQNNRYMRLSYPGALERSGSVSVSVVPLANNIELNPPSSANVNGEPTDIVAADFDGDGDLDLALTVPDANSPTTAPGQVVILKNAGNTGPGGAWAGFSGGQLTVNVGVNPRGLAVGRLNGDASDDLVVANYSSNTLTVLMNNGSGVMTPAQTVAVGTNPVAVVTGVFRDSSGGAVDVAVANQGSNSVTVLNNTGGTLSFAATLAAGDSPTDVAIARLDAGSSTLDLVVTNGGDNTVSVYYRPPAGGFPTGPSRVLPTGIRPVHVEPGGLDNPKDLNDLAVTNFDGGSTSILLNNNLPGAQAGFQPKADLPSGLNPDSLSLGDLDNDGDDDLSVVTTVNGERVVRVFRNDQQDLGNGQFQAAFAPFGDQYAGTQPQLVISGDVNNDGREDLIAVNEQTLVLRPGADGTPERVVTAQPGVATSLSIDSSAPPPCPADLVGNDGVVNTADLVFFLGRFGQPVTPGSPEERADFNHDGQVNTVDLVFFLGRFGQPCP